MKKALYIALAAWLAVGLFGSCDTSTTAGGGAAAGGSQIVTPEPDEADIGIDPLFGTWIEEGGRLAYEEPNTNPEGFVVKLAITINDDAGKTFAISMNGQSQPLATGTYSRRGPTVTLDIARVHSDLLGLVFKPVWGGWYAIGDLRASLLAAGRYDKDDESSMEQLEFDLGIIFSPLRGAWQATGAGQMLVFRPELALIDEDPNFLPLINPSFLFNPDGSLRWIEDVVTFTKTPWVKWNVQ